MGRFELCTLLLMDDARFPWFILVPRRPGVEEIFQLDAPDRERLLLESCTLGERLMGTFDADKLNVAALGNVVPQLHVHHVLRRHDDAEWPAPVWGRGTAVPYGANERESIIVRVRTLLADCLEEA